LVVAAGLPAGFHFHDLRHTGNILAAASGASTRELMHRMGHGSMRAALIYQHATSQRDQEIATALDARIKREAGEKWPVRGPKAAEHGSVGGVNADQSTSDLEQCCGAGDENRTRMTSLEGWGSAIELHPRGRARSRGDRTRTCDLLLPKQTR
jgi:hypothetical protein